MPVYIGTTDITDIRVGVTAATKVYLGTIEVWPVAPAGAVIAATATEIGENFGGTNTFPNPAGVTAGQLLVATCNQKNAGAMTVSTGWTQLMQLTQSSTFRVGVWARVADGGANDTFTISGASTTGDYCAAVMRITGHGVTTVSTDVKQANAGGSATAANPPSLDTGTSRNWLWLAIMHLDGTTGTTITAVPTNYTQVVNLKSADTTASILLAIAQRSLTAQTEDPGLFTNTVRAWTGITIAIPPAP